MSLNKIYPYSLEQAAFLTQSVAWINICDGPVRAGKNFIQNIRFKNYCKLEPYDDPKSDIAFCGVTKESVYRNFLKDFLTLVGEKNHTYHRQLGRGTIYGRDFYVWSFKDADDWKAIQGTTLGGFLMTEGLHCHKDFWDMLLSRLSIAGAKAFIDLNPAGEGHWFYKEILTNEEMLAAGDIRRFRFNFDSNLSLDPEFKEMLKRKYVPGSLLYRRMILGEWCSSEGVVYSQFDHQKHTIDPSQVPPKLKTIWVPLDYGTQNPTVFGQLAKDGNKYYLVDEFYHHGAKEGQKRGSEYAEDMRVFISNMPARPRSIIADPSAAAFKADLKHILPGISVIDADNDVLTGIATVTRLLGNGQLLISRKCKNTINEIGLYSWDKKYSDRTGEDKPIKKHDHCMDMLRYGCHTTLHNQVTIGKGWFS